MVEADSVNLDRYSVETEAFVGIELKVADSERSLVSVNFLVCRTVFYDGHKGVEVRVLQRPEFRTLKLVDFLADFRLPIHGHRLGHTCLLNAVSIDDGADEGHIGRFGAAVFQCRGHADVSRAVLGHFGGHVCAPIGYMNRIELGQPDISVDAAAGIPAGIRLLGVVDPDGNHVVPAPVQIRGKVISERDIAVRPHSKRMSVDEDLGVHIYAVKVDVDLPALVLCRDRKYLAVPSDAPWERSPARSGRIVGGKFALDGPVMRQVERAPLSRLGQIHRLAAGHFAKVEVPPFVEADDLARAVSRLPRRAGADRENGGKQYYKYTFHGPRV